MDTRYIAGKAVGALGFGCMNVSHAYGNPPAKEVAQALLRRAAIWVFDTSIQQRYMVLVVTRS